MIKNCEIESRNEEISIFSKLSKLMTIAIKIKEIKFEVKIVMCGLNTIPKII